MPRTILPLFYRALTLTAALLLGGALAQETSPTVANPGVAMSPSGLANGTNGIVTVQPGDTAYGLARRAGITVEQLLALNKLTSTNLKVGQVLRVRDTLAHTVQAGETLYAISRRYGVSVDALLAENLLPVGAVLSVGQVLKLPAGASLPANLTLATAPPNQPTPSTPAMPAVTATPLPAGVGGSPFLPSSPVQSAPVLTQPDQLPVNPGDPNSVAPTPTPTPTGQQFLAPLPSNWRDAALAMLGTPYVYGGKSRTGTDCSGLVLQVFTPLGVKLPRVSAEQARVGQAVSASELQPGDLVFFDTEGSGRVTHVGIYLGDDQFVNANSYQGKVVIDKLMADRYWGPRYVGARRILSGVTAQTP